MLIQSDQHLPTRPNSSTPRAANIKNNRKKRRPRFPTSGSACITVSNSARTDLAIFSNFSTEQQFSSTTKLTSLPVRNLLPLYATTESNIVAVPGEYVGNLRLRRARPYCQRQAPMAYYVKNMASFTKPEMHNMAFSS